MKTKVTVVIVVIVVMEVSIMSVRIPIQKTKMELKAKLRNSIDSKGRNNISESCSKRNSIKRSESSDSCQNKPAAQAAGKDPSKCNSTNRQSTPHPEKPLLL